MELYIVCNKQSYIQYWPHCTFTLYIKCTATLQNRPQTTRENVGFISVFFWGAAGWEDLSWVVQQQSLSVLYPIAIINKFYSTEVLSFECFQLFVIALRTCLHQWPRQGPCLIFSPSTSPFLFTTCKQLDRCAPVTHSQAWLNRSVCPPIPKFSICYYLH